MKHDEILLELESFKLIQEQQQRIDDSAPIIRSDKLDRKSIQVVRAKYAYEPMTSSPNDHPELELPLKIGEFYIVYGKVDEVCDRVLFLNIFNSIDTLIFKDGFYDGQNLDGRLGLIPSNFVEVVRSANDMRVSIQEPKTSSSNPRISTTDSDVFVIPRFPLKSSSSENSSENSSTGKVSIPAPTRLRIEKIFTSSVLIAWDPPSTIDPTILGYQVVLDRAIYSTTRANEQTRALIENLNFKQQVHRVSIRTVTQRGVSHAQQCTLLVHPSSPTTKAPTDVHVDRISQNSAVLSWWPASSELSHRILINNVDLQTMKPGAYRLKLVGLAPNTKHVVTVQATPSSVPSTSSIEFRTTPSTASALAISKTSSDVFDPTPLIPGSPSNLSSISSEIPQIEVKPIEQKPSTINTRLFVALYDYDPKSMSPNSDNDAELPFKKDQNIKVN